MGFVLHAGVDEELFAARAAFAMGETVVEGVARGRALANFAGCGYTFYWNVMFPKTDVVPQSLACPSFVPRTPRCLPNHRFP